MNYARRLNSPRDFRTQNSRRFCGFCTSDPPKGCACSWICYVGNRYCYGHSSNRNTPIYAETFLWSRELGSQWENIERFACQNARLYQGCVPGMLIRNLTAEHVYLACGRTDMRKSIDGLAALVLSKFQLDPHQPALFLFCGRRKDRIKGLL